MISRLENIQCCVLYQLQMIYLEDFTLADLHPHLKYHPFILFNVLSSQKRKVEERRLMRSSYTVCVSLCPTSTFNQAEPLTSNLM